MAVTEASNTINAINLATLLYNHYREVFDGASISHKNVVFSLTQYLIDNSVAKDGVNSLSDALDNFVALNDANK